MDLRIQRKLKMIYSISSFKNTKEQNQKSFIINPEPKLTEKVKNHNSTRDGSTSTRRNVDKQWTGAPNSSLASPTQRRETMAQQTAVSQKQSQEKHQDKTPPTDKIQQEDYFLFTINSENNSADNLNQSSEV